jgi:glycosyltransferase involved in cell wall biosynthesis
MMIYLAWVILFFTCLQMLNALANLIFRPELRKYYSDMEPFLSILIPARNEQENIDGILSDIVAQSDINFEVLVYDDESSDNTAGLVNDWSLRNNRIRLIPSEILPAGWFGKNFACHSLAKEAKGDYLLFIDADVRLRGDVLRNLIAYMDRHKLGLLSIFPHQVMISLGERVAVPIMNYILLTLLPLFLVRKSGFISLSAANGQFMLFNGQNYRQTEPHSLMRNCKAEDIAISRYFKKHKVPVACLTGSKSVSCRMYKGFNEAVDGFSKNVAAFFGNSYLLAILFWTVTTFGFIVFPLADQYAMLFVYFLVCLLTRVLVSVASHQPIGDNLFLIFQQQFTLAIIIHRSLKNRIKKEFQWKGRNIS